MRSSCRIRMENTMMNKYIVFAFCCCLFAFFREGVLIRLLNALSASEDPAYNWKVVCLMPVTVTRFFPIFRARFMIDGRFLKNILPFFLLMAAIIGVWRLIEEAQQTNHMTSQSPVRLDLIDTRPLLQSFLKLAGKISSRSLFLLPTQMSSLADLYNTKLSNKRERLRYWRS